MSTLMDLVRPKKGPARVLTQSDLLGPAWTKLKAHYEQRLEIYRSKNDASQSIERTEKLRGRIAEIKAFLALADPAPLVVEPDDDPA